MLVKIEDIKIAEEMKATPPKRERIDSKKAYYIKHGCFEKPAEINRNHVLIDGYATYLIAQELGMDVVEGELKPDRIIEDGRKHMWNKKANSRKFNAEQRKIIYEHNHGICAICGRSVAFEEFTIDHWKPLAKGGTNELNNLKVAHRSCNLIKGSFQPEMLMNELAEILAYQSRQNEEIAKSMIHTSIKLVITMTARKIRSFVF